jgi:hypothetical protein
MGPFFARLIRTEAVALAAAFALLVVGTGALADRYVDQSGELLKRTADAATREGAYRFTTSQKYSGTYAQSARYSAGVRLSGAVDIRSNATRYDTLIQLPGITAKCTYITVGDDLFVSVHPSRRSQLGATWLRAEATGRLATGALQGVRPDELNTRAAKLFEGLEPSGSATIRGVRTTRYSGKIGIEALAGPNAKNTTLGRTTTRTLPVEVYVDGRDLLRRVTIVITAAKAFSVRFTTDLYDYGKPLTIAKPPAGAVKQANAQDLALACYPTAFPTTPRSSGGLPRKGEIPNP